MSIKNELGCIFKRIQFPAVLGYYVEFNWDQVQSVNKCGFKFPKSVFNHGQFYVGLSRFGYSKKIFIHAD